MELKNPVVTLITPQRFDFWREWWWYAEPQHKTECLVKKGKSLRIHPFIVSLPPWGHTSRHSFSTYTDSIYYLKVPTLLHPFSRWLHPEFLLLLHLPFESSTNFPHLITLCLDLSRTKSKYPYFIGCLPKFIITDLCRNKPRINVVFMNIKFYRPCPDRANRFYAGINIYAKK